MWQDRHPEGNSHLPKGKHKQHIYVRYLKQMVRFFLVWKSLNISFDEPIPPFLNSYDFFFWDLYIVLSPSKPIYTLTTYHMYVYKHMKYTYEIHHMLNSLKITIDKQCHVFHMNPLHLLRILQPFLIPILSHHILSRKSSGLLIPCMGAFSRILSSCCPPLHHLFQCYYIYSEI